MKTTLELPCPVCKEDIEVAYWSGTMRDPSEVELTGPHPCATSKLVDQKEYLAYLTEAADYQYNDRH